MAVYSCRIAHLLNLRNEVVFPPKNLFSFRMGIRGLRIRDNSQGAGFNKLVGQNQSFNNGVRILDESDFSVDNASGGGDDDDDGGNGKVLGGGGGGNPDDEEEFGPLLEFAEVIRLIEARGAKLPSDMLEAAKTLGIRRLLLHRYLDLQGSAWPLGFAMRSCEMLRNRMLADPTFLFKIGTEIVIDTCCATFAEVQKRGKDFWAEFELYTADMLVGVVVNVALVGMLAPYARIGKLPTSQGLLGRMQHAYAALPSSVFEAERPGCSFTVKQRIGTYFYKGIMYGFVGFGCGIIGQGIANLIMTAKRYSSILKYLHKCIACIHSFFQLRLLRITGRNKELFDRKLIKYKKDNKTAATIVVDIMR
ncbi:hypothetical protein AgCh_018301 [Apium graveolens]